MQRNRNLKSAGATVEGLEARQFLSASPAVIFAPPAFGEAAGLPIPAIFDNAFISLRGMPMMGFPVAIADTVAVASTPVAVTNATPAVAATFSGYPTAAASDGNSASLSMGPVNRAVDAGFVPTGTAQSGSASEVSRSAATSTIAAPQAAMVAHESAAASTPSAPVLPDGRIAPPVAVFYTEPIKTEAGAAGMNAISASLRSAEEQVACVVRLAWADIAYTRAGESLGRLATEAGQALGRHATEAELAAAIVMGVAGAAWWVKQGNDEVAEPIEEKRSLIETVNPRPLAG